MKGRTLLGLLLVVLFAVSYAGIIIARQGPPPGGDTVPLTSVTSSVASGQLHEAAANDGLPNPPGYPLLVAPLVAAFPSLVGSPSWCLTPGRAATLHQLSQYVHDPNFGAEVDECGVASPFGTYPNWYRSQGLLGLLSWLVLAAGALALLGASHAASTGRMVGLLAFLTLLPAASSAIVQLFHPQDIVSLGLALGAMAQTLKRRWILAGALFGVAVLTKQVALLLLIPALAVAPGTKERLRIGLSALVVLAAGLLPFLVSSPRATLENFSGFSAGGAVSGATVLSLSGISGSVTSAVARDAPVLFAIGICLWALHKRGPWLAQPAALTALGLACVSGRLVFESVIFSYYLLAPSVLFFMVDLVARRSPYRSLAWCAGAAFFVAIHPGNEAVAALGTLAFALLAVLAGLMEVRGLRANDAPPTAAVRDAQSSATALP